MASSEGTKGQSKRVFFFFSVQQLFPIEAEQKGIWSTELRKLAYMSSKNKKKSYMANNYFQIMS